MKLSPLLSQKRTVLLLLLFLFAIERLSLPPERGHNFIVIPGRFSHNTKSADAIFCLSTSMPASVSVQFSLQFSSVRRSRPHTVAARRGGEILGMRSSRLLAREGLNSKDYLLIRPLLQILSRAGGRGSGRAPSSPS